MNKKVLTKTTLSVIAVLLIAVLAVTMSFFLESQQQSVSAATNEQLMYAQYNGTNGQITDDAAEGGHYTKSQIAANLGIEDPNLILAITTGAELYNYMNGSSSYNYAYLANDVAIAFSDINKSGYDKVSAHSSGALFTKYLDGNGYSLSIEAGSGNGTFYESYENLGNTNKDDSRTGKYWYTGYLCGVNQGTIKNLTINFSSNHIITQSVSNPNALYVPQGAGVIAGLGVIAGWNKGTIDNVRLNLNGVFGVYMKPGGDRTLFENTSYVGGISGVMTTGIISNSQVNIATDGGVAVFVEGQTASWGNHWNTGSVAGGILGKIQVGDAKVQYCAVTGSGRIYACSRTSHGDVTKMSFAGGAIGTSHNLAGHVIFDEAVVNEGQIQGIISSWTGTREDNWGDNYKSVKGLLFDAVGKNVQSCAVLYNLNLLTKENGGTEYSTLDSSRQIDNWTEIYPSSTGGTMSVRYDTTTALYDLRIEAVADGHDSEKAAISDFDMSGTAVAYHKYFLEEGTAGKIIWSGVFEKNGVATNHIDMKLDKPIYAEIYMLKSTDYGKFNYTFGSMGNITYSDSGNYVDGKNVKGYTGQSGVLKLPNATYEGEGQITGDFEWEVLRDGVATDINQTYMPGTYRMRTAVKMGTNTYGYYNETDRIMAWQSKDDYVFTITQGVLTYNADGTTQSSGWVKSYQFTLEMPQANDFDLLRYQQNGVFTDDQVEVADTERMATVVTTQGTGKNGMQYTFYAYKFDDMLQDYVVVAVSENRTVKIDNEAPEIYDVQYYTENTDQVRTPVTEAILNSWQKEKVVVTYKVSDNGKSGLQVVGNINGVTTNVKQGADYEVTVELKNNTAYSIDYVDVAGNATSFDIQAKVDLNSGSLTGSTNYEAYFGMYDYDGFTITTSASVGNSGWTAYVSDSVDENGEPVWKELGAVTDGSQQFPVVWNMGDPDQMIAAEFKMKMVNDAGLYEDVYINGTTDGKLGDYIVYIKMADFYINTTLESIVDNQGRTLKDILASDPDFFNKVYDGTQGYAGIELKIDLTKTNGFEMVKTPLYSATPVTPDFSEIKLVFEYERASIGDTNIRMWAVLEGDADYKFDVWFADLSQDNYAENAVAIHKLPAAITKLQVTVNLNEYLDAQYYYGDEIPTYIDAVINGDETERIDLSTLAKKGATVGTYTVEGKLHTPNDSIDITINNTKIEIVALPVYVDVKLDGGEISDFSFDGKQHLLTGTYVDVINGGTKKAVIEYYLGENRVPTSGMDTIGTYYCDIKTGDVNYVVDTSLMPSTIEIRVLKGYLQIPTGVVNVDYSGKENVYDLKFTEEQKKFIKDGDITITYYKYNDGASFDGQQMNGTYDRNTPAANTIDRGFYAVFINVNETEYFYPGTYEALLIVNMAKTQVTAGETVSYAYDDLKHTYDLVKGKIEVKATASEDKLWDSTMPNDGKLVVQYYDSESRTYLDIDTSEDKAFGWYLSVGEYSFRVRYLGDENYQESYLDVKLNITKAEFLDVIFEDVTGVYNGSPYRVTEFIPDKYKTGTTISYYYNGRNYTSLDDIKCVNAGIYRISLRMSKDNYTPLIMDATVTINAAKLDITVDTLVSTYNGEPQYLNFNGLTRRGNEYFYMDHGKEVTALLFGTLYVVDAGAYAGSVTISVNNYEQLVLSTYIEMYPAVIKATNASIDLPDKLPSGVSVTKYSGSYTDENGASKTGKLLFYAKNEETGEDGLVQPDENGVLPDGIYTVRIEVDRNHYLEQAWNFRVGQLNDKNISTTGWIVIGVVVALMIAAIITSIVTVQRRKKRGTV